MNRTAPVAAGILWVLLWLPVGLAAAAPVIADAPSVDLNPHLEYLVDSEGTLALADVSGAAAERFRPHEGAGALNLGLSDAALWIRLQLQAPGAERVRRLLEVGYFGLVDVRFYAPNGDVVKTGYNDAIDERPFPHRHFIFPLELPAGDVGTYYLRIASNGSVTAPLTLWSPQAFAVSDRVSVVGLMLYFGVLVGLLLYNLFLYLYLRERQYLLYCLFLAFVGAGMFVHNGFRAYLLLLLPGWPDTLGTNSLFSAAGVFGIWFLRVFLATRRDQPVLDRILLACMAGFALIAVSPALGVAVRVGTVSISVLGALVAPLLLWVSYRGWRKGYPGARFLLFAWAILLMGVMTQALRNFAVIPSTDVTVNLLQAGSVVEMLLLSFALADRIQTERRAREAAQAKALAAERQLVEGLKASEQRLEATVQARTEDLSQALERERETLDQYVQFAGLISHEFRNPLAVIKAQAQVGIAERERGVGEPEQRFEVIVGAASRLQTLFDQWLESERLADGDQEVVRRRLSLGDWLPDLLDSERLMLPNPIRLHDLEGEIEADEALVGNAVYNLVENAAKYSAEADPIDIRVVKTATEVGIRVRDQGLGMSPAEQARAFERHYRAPNNVSVRGMGVGLFLVRRVMETHGGRVELQSQPGRGSTFTLWFPAAETGG